MAPRGSLERRSSARIGKEVALGPLARLTGTFELEDVEYHRGIVDRFKAWLASWIYEDYEGLVIWLQSGCVSGKHELKCTQL